jgi:hypothetical protein
VLVAITVRVAPLFEQLRFITQLEIPLELDLDLGEGSLGQVTGQGGGHVVVSSVVMQLPSQKSGSSSVPGPWPGHSLMQSSGS